MGQPELAQGLAKGQVGGEFELTDKPVNGLCIEQRDMAPTDGGSPLQTVATEVAAWVGKRERALTAAGVIP
ncbi:MAG: hypothetical protein OQL20_05240 [Sedimenticola sp.]|nr:hypothetical protein [Sedimenticola sp.]